MTRAQETYRHLLDELLRGRWQPGDIVSTNALAEELRLSRTPVLQAMKRLESEGLVEIVPQVGCRILKPTVGGLEDLFAIRAGLEGVAAAHQLPSHTLLGYERYIEMAESPRVRIIGEVSWSGESPAPMSEWVRYESALNVAFAHQPATIMCPYDSRELPEDIVADARRTHPELCEGLEVSPSPEFTDTGELMRELDRQGFPPPPAPASELPIQGNLPAVRGFILQQAKRAGVSGKSLQDIFLAVQEVAGAVITHGSERGAIRAWIADSSLVFEVRDDAPGLGDPLSGQLPSDPAMLLEPRGLWMARLLCDLVEVRLGDRGLVVRLNVSFH